KVVGLQVLGDFDSSTCGRQKGCFIPSDPECYQGCNGMKYSWLQLDDDLMQIELVVDASDTTDGIYVAVGFSEDDLMGSEFFLNSTTSLTDGHVYCAAVLNVTGASTAGLFRFDFSQSYYLLMANGPTTDSGLLHHVHDVTSAKPLKPSDVPPSNGSTNFYVAVSFATDSGFQNMSTIECSSLNEETLSMKFSYNYDSTTNIRIPGEEVLNDSLMRIELFSIATDNSQYIAVGFSDDDHMGNDYVIECSALSKQEYSMKFSYNDATPQNVRIPGEEGLDNVIECSALTGAQLSMKFSYNPTTKNVRIAGEEVAILMLISWFFFVPTAVMFARFLRASWPTVKPGGLLIWFHVSFEALRKKESCSRC
ncbi:hypothetical protein GCK32_001895, partial [Trichostrongylus colubriformis]